MVAKIKSSFLKNGFQLFCYKTILSKDVTPSTTPAANNSANLDDDLKRLSNSSPNLALTKSNNNHRKPGDSRSKKQQKDQSKRSSSSNSKLTSDNTAANSSLTNSKSQQLISDQETSKTNNHRSLITTKFNKKINKSGVSDLVILSDIEDNQENKLITSGNQMQNMYTNEMPKRSKSSSYVISSPSPASTSTTTSNQSDVNINTTTIKNGGENNFKLKILKAKNNSKHTDQENQNDSSRLNNEQQQQQQSQNNRHSYPHSGSSPVKNNNYTTIDLINAPTIYSSIPEVITNNENNINNNNNNNNQNTSNSNSIIVNNNNNNSSLYKNNNSIASLKLAKKLMTKSNSNNVNTNNTNSPSFASNLNQQTNKNLIYKSSILQNDSSKRRMLSSVNGKKAVRFADALGLELESVITVNNQLDASNQMRRIRIARNTNTNNYNYSPYPNLAHTNSILAAYSQRNTINNYFNLNPNYTEFIDTNYYADNLNRINLEVINDEKNGLHLYDQVIDQLAFEKNNVNLMNGNTNLNGSSGNNFEDQYELILEKQNQQYQNNNNNNNGASLSNQQSSYYNQLFNENDLMKTHNVIQINNENYTELDKLKQINHLNNNSQRVINPSTSTTKLIRQSSGINNNNNMLQNLQSNQQNITITTRINNGKLESEV